MARKMKKFAAGGRAERGQDRYDRMIADIEKDYQKAQGRKSGRGLEVARAKYEQRMADAKDDLAKARGEDRTASRAAERAAERELTMTRRFGARKVPALEDTGPLVRPSVHDDLKTPMPSLKPSAPTRRAAAPTPQRRAATPAPRRETPTPQRRETPAPTGIPASIARMGIKDYLPEIGRAHV